MITGNLGKDPEIRYTQNSMKVVQLSVATSEYQKKDDGNFAEILTWHKCRATGYAADKLEKHAQKGSRVEIQGSYRNVRRKDAATGKEYTYMELHVDRVDIVDKRKTQPQAPAAFAGNKPGDGFEAGAKNAFEQNK
jgi:single-strand DNA-binding protein